MTAVAAALGFERQRASRLATAVAAARRQTLHLQGLRQEGQHLIDEQLPAEERIRLEREQAGLEALRARVAVLQKETAGVAGGNDGGPVPASDWSYAGRASPSSAFESVLWTASHGDVDHLAGLLDFAADARTRAEALFARLPPDAQQQYGSAQKVIATLLAGSFPKDASAMTTITDFQGEGRAALMIRVDHSEGSFHQNVYQFSRSTDGWQLMVPASVIADCEKTLADLPQPPEGPAP